MFRKKWHIVIERFDLNDERLENIVIGPFKSKTLAIDHMQFSLDVDDWCYGEAKAKDYWVNEVYVSKKPDIPSYGVNAPWEDSSD